MMNKRNRIQSGKKPVKKIINKNLIEQQNKKEEERKKKAEEERINYLELFDKMRDYLEKEEDDEDVQLNFKYKLCKGLVQETNLSLNAYNDYLELMEIAKERKLRGDYDYNNMVENKNDKIKPKLTAYNKFLNNIARMETYVDSDGKIAVKKNVPVTGFGKKLAKSILLMKKKK